VALDPRGYFNAIYGTPWQDQLLTDLALAALGDPGLALGRRGVPDLLALSFSAHDVVSHSFGNESEEELDALRRLDRDLGRLLAALDALAAAEPQGRVVLALSSDHGFSPLPEVVRRAGGRRTGGRLQSAESGVDTPYPNVQERLNRALSEALCLSPGSQPIFGVEGWTVAYDRAAFPAQTVEGACGAAGQTVTVADLDRVFPEVVRRFYGEEIEAVLLISQRASWPVDSPAVSFAQNDFDAQRSGDAFLVPRTRPHALGSRARLRSRLASRVRHARAGPVLGAAVPGAGNRRGLHSLRSRGHPGRRAGCPATRCDRNLTRAAPLIRSRAVTLRSWRCDRRRIG
jgi:hypothetical protein